MLFWFFSCQFLHIRYPPAPAMASSTEQSENIVRRATFKNQLSLKTVYSQTGRMAQAAAEPLAVESTWIDVLTFASEIKTNRVRNQKGLNI